jgi:hypothetical protein
MQAMTSHICTELSKPNDKIRELGYNIIKFHDWAKEQLAALAARGETTTNLMVNLFTGYEAGSLVPTLLVRKVSARRARL